MQTELQQWWGQTADIGYGGIFVLLLLQSYSMGMFHSAVGWSQFLRQQNYYWREKLWRLHEDLLFICSFGSHFAILHMVSMAFGGFGIIQKEDCRPWRPAQRCRLHWDGSAIFSHDNLVIYFLRKCFTKSVISSWSPYQGRCALCRCSWPKPGSTASLPPANKQLMSEQS